MSYRYWHIVEKYANYANANKHILKKKGLFMTLRSRLCATSRFRTSVGRTDFGLDLAFMAHNFIHLNQRGHLYKKVREFRSTFLAIRVTNEFKVASVNYLKMVPLFLVP